MTNERRLDLPSDDPHPEEDGMERAADERLVDALLRHTYDDEAAGRREQRVQGVLRAIRREAQLSPSRTERPEADRLRILRPRRLGAWAAAALVLVAIGLWALTFGSAPAMASVSDIVDSLTRPGDRTYHIRMVDLPAPPEGHPPEDRQPRQVPKPGLDRATLHLRDGRQYLLVREDPNGGVIYDGFDGRRSWRVKDGTVAEMREGLGAGGIPIPPLMADIPFTDLHRTLTRILVDYEVEHLGQASLRGDGDMLRYVKVRRSSRDVKGPETIEIWADPDPEGALPRRIHFDDAMLPGNPGPCRLSFDLHSEDSLPPSWFTPAPHLSSDD